MSSSAVVDRDAVTAAFDALDAAVDGVLGLDFEALATRERLALLERCERVRRRLPAVEHPLINQLAHHATPEELGGKLSHAVAEWTLISRAEAGRRIREAADLGPRRTITGEPLAPALATTAASQREGKLGAGHVAVIRRFYHQLPGWVDTTTRDQAEADLAKQGIQCRPEQLAGLAERLADCVNPDGTYSDDDRARRRGVTLGKQGPDGMSELRGWLTPELRASLEAVWAKLAAPGMCNPADDSACVLDLLHVDADGLTDATEFEDVKAIAQICPQIKEITAAGETPEQLALHRLATLTERAGFGAHPHLLREREANVVLPTWSRVRGHDSHRREGGR
jgi:hypothetical protein